jgi:hypothetical protein
MMVLPYLNFTSMVPLVFGVICMVRLPHSRIFTFSGKTLTFLLSNSMLIPGPGRLVVTRFFERSRDSTANA